MNAADQEAITEIASLPQDRQVAAGRYVLDLWERRLGKRAVWSLMPLQARPGDWAAARDYVCVCCPPGPARKQNDDPKAPRAQL